MKIGIYMIKISDPIQEENPDYDVGAMNYL